jgi:hypothetical protein
MYLKLKNEVGKEPIRKSCFGIDFGVKYLNTATEIMYFVTESK